MRLKGPKFLGHWNYKEGQNGEVGTNSKGEGIPHLEKLERVCGVYVWITKWC